MAVERVFVGWDGPCLPRAAGWLRGHVAADSHKVWDLSTLLLVLPGGRAARRMSELLAEAAERDGLLQLPPEAVTQGGLAERLYEPGLPVAGEFESLLAWAAALRDAEGDDAQVLLPRGLAADDMAGWLAAAGEVAAVAGELAGLGLTPANVLPRLEARQWVDFPDVQRWEAMARLHARYEAILAERGRMDRDRARREAVTGGRCRCDRRIVLIGCADLPASTATMLLQLTTPVTALVHAPESERDGFDELGVLRAESWRGRTVPLDESRWHAVNAPREQTEQVLRLLEREGPGYAADQITVGLGDAGQAGPIQRALQLAGVPARSAEGPKLTATAPIRLLTGLGRFIGSRRFDDLAALLRHPDVEAHVGRPEGVASWLTLLDTYIGDHLQRRVSDTWLGDEATRTAMKAVHDAVVALLPHDPQARRPLAAWAHPLAAALTAVYDTREWRRHAPHDRLVIGSLQLTGGLLRELAQLDPAWEGVPQVTAAQAVQVVAARARDAALPEPGGEPAVELLGWLELAMDDAPLLIVTGFNEGLIPASRGADPWLPDSIRAALDLPDDRRRLARDTFLLTAMLNSRPAMHVITCRTTAEGDPIPPSRLLLACDDATRAARLQRLYDEVHTGSGVDAAPLLLLPAGQGRFVIPRPPADPPVLTQLGVTGFAQYLACPYRFYLRYVLKLRAMDDQARELAGDRFGNLAHLVLADFGRDPCASAASAAAMTALLDARLDHHMQQQFGTAPPAAVRLQARILRDRLHAFARWQAGHAREGWRTLHVEQQLQRELMIDGQPFTITGRIDRIDRHDADGRIRVLDYKTSESAVTPDQAHRGDKADPLAWTALQLPLYRKLIPSLGLDEDAELGYINLPLAPDQVGLSAAAWTLEELHAAEELAVEVIRKIRSGVYWPPAEPPRWTDEFAGICMDGTLDGAEFRRGLEGEEASP